MQTGKVTRVKRFSLIVDDKSTDNSNENLIFISVGLTCLKASSRQTVELDQDMSDFSVFKSCSDNYSSFFHHSQPIAITIAIFEFTYIK